MKVCEVCGDEIYTADGDNRCPRCEEDDGVQERKAKERRAKARANRKAKDDIMRSLGLTKVRGALGGTYWE